LKVLKPKLINRRIKIWTTWFSWVYPSRRNFGKKLLSIWTNKLIYKFLTRLCIPNAQSGLKFYVTKLYFIGRKEYLCITSFLPHEKTCPFPTPVYRFPKPGR
jgi:hypothetical protein